MNHLIESCISSVCRNFAWGRNTFLQEVGSREKFVKSSPGYRFSLSRLISSFKFYFMSKQMEGDQCKIFVGGGVFVSAFKLFADEILGPQ